MESLTIIDPDLTLSTYTDGVLEKLHAVVVGVDEETSPLEEDVPPVEGPIPVQDGPIISSFLEGRKYWNEDPIMAHWRQPDERVRGVLKQVEELHTSWRHIRPGPFSPNSDPLWTSTVAAMRNAGLPLHNNNINLPEDIDESWPFHFKEAERFAVVSKGSRVGDPDPAGYVCNWNEANHFCIRAIQQEIRREMPDKKPLLVACKFDVPLLRHISRLLGLNLEVWDSVVDPAEDKGVDLEMRPLIFAATLCNTNSEADDFNAIRRLAGHRPVWIHVDAARSFDYITTLSPAARARLAIPRLMLTRSNRGHISRDESYICASTIVAGGMGGFDPSPVVALKPRALGNHEDRKIQYVKATDSTISGSRDALGPLLLGLQEQRFESRALRRIYRRCSKNRDYVVSLLESVGVTVQCPPFSLDILFASSSEIPEDSFATLGLRRCGPSAYTATIKPSLDVKDITNLLTACSLSASVSLPPFQVLTTHPYEFPLPGPINTNLKDKVAIWRSRLGTSAGYPFNQGPTTALGPILGHFLDLNSPEEWTRSQANAILTQRKKSFGVEDSDLSLFGSTFTTGSTMGNQIGIHAAIETFPENFIYISSAAHYSASKSLLDSDDLMGRWHSNSVPRFAIIPTDETGRMSSDALTKQVLADRQTCHERNRKYGVTLFVTSGTTFVGAEDDILGLQRALRKINQEVSYIHVDGALDFGFSSCRIRLVSPDALPWHLENNIPAAQGITLSHHKAYGTMVSGEVLCYDPLQKYIPSTCSVLNPRAVFEVWLFQQMFSADDMQYLKEYSLRNAAYLRKRLREVGIPVKPHKCSTIVVLAKPPSLIVNDWGLRCEDDWAHFITMPHISRGAIDMFVEDVAL